MAVLYNDLTNVNGEVTFQYNYISDQNIQGSVRKSSSIPLYKANSVSATIESQGLEITIFMIPDE